MDPKKIHYFVYINQEKMKKLLSLLTVAVCCSFTTIIAQPPAGGQSMEQRIAAQKERFKSLGLNDVQVDSVMAISADMRPKQMALRDVAEADRPAKMKEIAEERNKRLEKALPAELAKKVIEAMSQQRPGGGRGGVGR
ncbi:MAG: hypothetical protein FD136_1315 [Chitinophagaceae bacterium]|nr:MAG: hypothetical protein FD136_1315 [Chitinophagaceae bacterium]